LILGPLTPDYNQRMRYDADLANEEAVRLIEAIASKQQLGNTIFQRLRQRVAHALLEARALQADEDDQPDKARYFRNQKQDVFSGL
jgi:hypothetical protein